MDYDIEKIIPSNYQRAFFFKNLGYLLSDLVNDHYKKRDFLSIYSEGMLGTYISNAAVEKTLKNGQEIFSSEENFKAFESGFRGIIKECGSYIVKTKKLKHATLGDFFDLWAIVRKCYYYFEKTEFFFTDACYEGEMSETLKNNLLVLGGDLKEKSRPQLVEILTTMLYHLAGLVAKQHGLDVEDVKAYSFDDIVRLFESDTKVDRVMILERQKSYVLYCVDNHVIPIQGKYKAQVIENFKETDYSGKSEFKGTIANKGKVTGKARVILAELDIPYDAFVKKLHAMPMDQGDILVTETTSPDFVPLMKKAGGIIANQGGLNSHAAIMSRELGVPCLVATYHATDILKTGDLIELDANNGIVKILGK